MLCLEFTLAATMHGLTMLSSNDEHSKCTPSHSDRSSDPDPRHWLQQEEVDEHDGGDRNNHHRGRRSDRYLRRSGDRYDGSVGCDDDSRQITPQQHHDRTKPGGTQGSAGRPGRCVCEAHELRHAKPVYPQHTGERLRRPRGRPGIVLDRFSKGCSRGASFSIPSAPA